MIVRRPDERWKVCLCRQIREAYVGVSDRGAAVDCFDRQAGLLRTSVAIRDLERFLAHARGTATAAKIISLDDLRAQHADAPAPWGLEAARGRLIELSARGASAVLTAAFELVGEAQAQSEPVAWLTSAAQSFYPPDVADSGIDLAALVVVRVADAMIAARTAERLLRSSAFGLVVIDLCGGSGADATAVLPGQVQGRLVTLAQTHDAAVVCLTEKTADTGSLGSLVSLRAEALRARDREQFTVTVRALKDKRRGPGWSHVATRRGPSGL